MNYPTNLVVPTYHDVTILEYDEDGKEYPLSLKSLLLSFKDQIGTLEAHVIKLQDRVKVIENERDFARSKAQTLENDLFMIGKTLNVPNDMLVPIVDQQPAKNWVDIPNQFTLHQDKSVIDHVMTMKDESSVSSVNTNDQPFNTNDYLY